MLAHVMDSLLVAGVDHITLIVGYLGEAVVAWARTAYPDIKVDFAVQEKADGLASAVLLAEEFVDSSPCMVVLGDTLFSADLSVLRGETRNMIVTAPVEDPSMFGVVVMENGRVVRLVEKPSEPVSKLAIVGVYYFADGSRLMQYCRKLKEREIRTRGEFQLTDAMELMLQNGEPFGILDIDGWYDCGNPVTLLETNRILLESIGGGGSPLLENSVVIQPCCFGEGTVIRNSVVGPFFSGGEGILIEDSRIRSTIAGADSAFFFAVLNNTVAGERSFFRGSPAKCFIGDDSVAEI